MPEAPIALRKASPDQLQIAGLARLSTCDWPGKIVATAFLQGCPWQCTYCHNPDLIDPRAAGQISWEEIKKFLARRRGLLDGLVFSGGEPTRQIQLGAAMREAKDMGFAVGLHTGGAYPRRLAAVLPLVDWVGLDIKAAPSKFEAVTRTRGGAGPAFESLRLVQESGVDVQVRTTVDPTTLAPSDVTELTELLAGLGVKDHVLQEVRPDGTTSEYREALAEAQRVAVG